MFKYNSFKKLLYYLDCLVNSNFLKECVISLSHKSIDDSHLYN